MEHAFARSVREHISRLMQGPMLLQLFVFAVIGIVLIIFIASYPAGLPLWRFYASVGSLGSLLIANIVFMTSGRTSARARGALGVWAFLIVCALLVFAAVALSRQSSLVYLLSIICGQATFRLGAWPAGLSFGAGCAVGLFAVQLWLGESRFVILGTETGLVLGVLFVVLLTTLLRRSAAQTERAQQLLAELKATQRELEAAHEKQTELAITGERVRFARDLHDSVSQLLYSVTLYAEAAAERLATGDVAIAAEHVQDLRDTAREALREMRLLLFELQQPSAIGTDLIPTLKERIEAVEKRCGVRARLDVEGAEQLCPPVRIGMYRIAQEALNNALKHSRATSVTVTVRFTAEVAELTIDDDGVGFVPETAARAGFLGLRGMKMRAEEMGAELEITSAPGCGSRVRVRVPAPGERANGA